MQHGTAYRCARLLAPRWRLAPLLAALALPAAAQTNAPARSPAEEATRLFEAVEARFEAVTSLQYTVEREAALGRKTQREEWQFAYRRPGDIRLVYRGGNQERTIVANADELWEYVPDARRAVRTNLAALGADERRNRLAAILARVAVDGIRVGDHRAMARRASGVTAESGCPDVAVVEGREPRYVVAVDTKRQALVRTEVCDTDGRVRVKTETCEWAEPAPGLWYPARLRIVHKLRDGYVTSDVAIRDIRINTPLPDATFRFTPPPATQVEQR